MTMTILETIVAHKREEVAARKQAIPLDVLIAEMPGRIAPLNFREALCNSDMPAPRVIAEVKRRSPSKGLLRPDLDAVELARTYRSNGAAAISVLADNRFFGGSLDDLRVVSAAVDVPVLCKEFVVDTYQIYEARLVGASAILLLASILSIDELSRFRLLATSLGMDSLVEVHNRAELKAALESGAEIVGINNRNLHTFTVDLDTTRSLRPMIPVGIVVVSESGIFNRDHRLLMHTLHIDALLVGESLLTSPDVALATREICGVETGLLEGSLR